MTDLPDPTRAAGLARLDAFLPKAGGAYARGRNFDRDGDVSGLSPWLRHRLVTEAEVLVRVRSEHGTKAAEKFISEVFWRTYFKGWLERRPSVWDDYRQGVLSGQARLETDAALRSAWVAACRGDTGIAAFDHWAHDLVSRGYLHNHARMWFASIWCFTLNLPWELGADFFYRHLMDGDPASNTLSWRWVAGLHTRGKVYAARASNIERYTEGRFSPKGQLNERPEPLEGPPHPPAGPVPSGEVPRLGVKTGLLLHEDDLTANHIKDFSGALVLRSQTPRSPWPTGDAAARFTEGALADAAMRFGTEVVDPEGAAEWASEFEQVVTPYAPVGPAAETLESLAFRPVRILRPFDARAWVHATGGYFKIRKAIPELMAAL